MTDSSSPDHTDASPACGGCTARRDFLWASAAALLAGVTLGPFSAIEALERGRGAVLKYPLPAADGVSIDANNEVIICRAGTEVFAFALSCPHQNTALKVMPKNRGFQCPKHKSRYQPNGTFIDGRATRNMDRLQVSRDGTLLVVDPDIVFQSDSDPAKWAAAVVHV